MTKLLKNLCSTIDQVSILSIYSLLLIENAFSQPTYVEVAQSSISHKG